MSSSSGTCWYGLLLSNHLYYTLLLWKTSHQTHPNDTSSDVGSNCSCDVWWCKVGITLEEVVGIGLAHNALDQNDVNPLRRCLALDPVDWDKQNQTPLQMNIS